MKKIFKYSFLLVAITNCLSFGFQQKEKNILEWNESRPLTWKDFKGKPEQRFAAASTHYDILKAISLSKSSCTITVRAVFFTDKSWKKDSWINDEVLIHEQKHFDIVEIFARKMRKALTQKKIESAAEAKTELQNTYEKYDKELDKYQDLYDEESDGSMNGDGQRKWNRKIKEELNQLKDYSSSILVLNFN